MNKLREFREMSPREKRLIQAIIHIYGISDFKGLGDFLTDFQKKNDYYENQYKDSIAKEYINLLNNIDFTY